METNKPPICSMEIEAESNPSKIPSNRSKPATAQRPTRLWTDAGIVVVLVLLMVMVRYIRYTCAYNYGLTGLSKFDNISQIVVLTTVALTFCFLLLLLTRLCWTIPQKLNRYLGIRFLLLILVGGVVYGSVKFPWGWSRLEALRSGFMSRMQREADVEAIRQWWLKISNQYYYGDYIDEKEWPKAVKQLNPHYVDVSNIAVLPLHVCLHWAGHGAEFWGLGIGPQYMVCPPPKDEGFWKEDYVSLEEGAYVFYINF